MEEVAHSPHTVKFGIFELDLQALELRKEGMKLKLTGQPLQVLAILLENPGKVLTRDELQKRLWANTFVDVDHNLNTAINRIREVLGDSAENPRFVETLPRRGYRFIAPVEEVPEIAARRPRGRYVFLQVVARHRILGWVVMVALVALLGFGLRILGQHRKAKLVSIPINSIAVLPLQNLSGDPGQEYFADGMTEALITELGKIRALRVISRTSAMTFRGTKKTLPEIARQLGTR